jgi:hypothetical protein
LPKLRLAHSGSAARQSTSQSLDNVIPPAANHGLRRRRPQVLHVGLVRRRRRIQRSQQILALQAYATRPSVAALPAPADTSVSIVTPPTVTRRVLLEAAAAGVPTVWLQLGSFDDDDALRFAHTQFRAAVAGPCGRGDEGWCVLVDGERAARVAGKL